MTYNIHQNEVAFFLTVTDHYGATPKTLSFATVEERSERMKELLADNRSFEIV
jgi:hypothetical protein|tara:strand:+ start:89 stop:247 length:159 start_codon:yes stop_codon:yes gene_type:complete